MPSKSLAGAAGALEKAAGNMASAAGGGAKQGAKKGAGNKD